MLAVLVAETEVVLMELCTAVASYSACLSRSV